MIANIARWAIFILFLAFIAGIVWHIIVAEREKDQIKREESEIRKRTIEDFRKRR